MRSLLSTVALAATAAVAATVGGLAPTALVQADTWCNDRPLNESFCVTGTEAGEWVDIVMTAPATVGWVSFGIGENHKDADIILAWLADGVTIVSPRYSTDYVEPKYDAAILANQQIIVFPDSRAANGTFKVHLQRRKIAMTDKDKTLYPGPQTYMYAMQTDSDYSPKSTDYQAHIMRHDIFGVIPQFSLYNTPIAKKPSPFTAEWLQKKTILTAHGWMMFVSWGIVAPLWAFSRRYVKGTSRVWDTVQFWSHIVLVGVMSLVAVGLGIYAVTPSAQFDDAHSIFGLIVFMIMFAEIGMNAYVFFKSPTTTGVSVSKGELEDHDSASGFPSRPFRISHTILTGLLLALAWVAIGTGIKQFAVRYGDNGLLTASLVIFSVYIALLAGGLIFVGERYMKRRSQVPSINMGSISSLTDTLGRKMEAALTKAKEATTSSSNSGDQNASTKYPVGAAGSSVLGYETDDQVLVNKSPYHQLED